LGFSVPNIKDVSYDRKGVWVGEGGGRGRAFHFSRVCKKEKIFRQEGLIEGERAQGKEISSFQREAAFVLSTGKGSR